MTPTTRPVSSRTGAAMSPSSAVFDPAGVRAASDSAMTPSQGPRSPAANHGLATTSRASVDPPFARTTAP